MRSSGDGLHSNQHSRSLHRRSLGGVCRAVGAESPKVVEWEELHQEISRLWSLSSSLAKSKERKESLSRKVQDFVKVREGSLRQSNELDNMREKLEARKFAMGDMSMSTKKILKDVRSQREGICISARMLLVAGENLSAAHQQLQEANKLLAGKRGHGNLRNLQKMLWMRQQYMITQVSTLYPVKASNQMNIKRSTIHMMEIQQSRRPQTRLNLSSQHL